MCFGAILDMLLTGHSWSLCVSRDFLFKIAGCKNFPMCSLIHSSSTIVYVSTCVPSIGGQVLGRSISADNRQITDWAFVNNWPMSYHYASMYDRFMTDIIDIGRTTWYATWNFRPSGDDHGCLTGNQSKMALWDYLADEDQLRKTYTYRCTR